MHNGTGERRWNVKGKSVCGRGGEGEEGRGRDVTNSPGECSVVHGVTAR